MTKSFKKTTDKTIKAGIVAFGVILITGFLFFKSRKFSSYSFIVLIAIFTLLNYIVEK